MHDLNRVQLIGHLGHDPQVTYTATGTARTTCSGMDRQEDPSRPDSTLHVRCGRLVNVPHLPGAPK
jgi:single-stranded DNA-binding protein